MSPPLSELSLDQHYPHLPDAYDSYYDPYPFLLTFPSHVSDFYSSDSNLYMYQDVDGIYHWADASATRSDGCIEHSSPLYHSSPFTSGLFPPSACYTYPHGDFAESSPPTGIHESSYTFHPTQQVSNGSNRQDHRSSIARASDNFLAQASSLFSDGHSSSRRGSTVDYRSSMAHQTSPLRDTRPPSRKRSRESLDDGNYHVKDKDDDAHPSLPAANEACRLPQPRMMMPSQGVHLSPVRVPHRGDAPASLDVESRPRERELRLRPEGRCAAPVPKHASNKRMHRASEGLALQESTIPTTWPNPDDQATKGSKKPGEQKKQALACLFCRERKIACGRPHASSPDQTCNQCARRRIKCEYPTESRRGQHKRRRKPVEGQPAHPQTTARTSSTSSVSSTTTAPSSTTLMNTSST